MPESQKKLVLMMRASVDDPDFVQMTVDPNGDGKRISYSAYLKDYFGAASLIMPPLSCHGNLTYTIAADRDLDTLATAGHRLVVLETGGLYFAKPGLDASQVPTVPFISIPAPATKSDMSDLVAFSAPMLPSGIAAIGGTGVGCYRTALNVAAGILKNTEPGVYIHRHQEPTESEMRLETALLAALHDMSVPDLGPYTSGCSGLVIDYCDDPPHVRKMERSTRILAVLDPSTEYLSSLALAASKMTNTVYTRGAMNAAIFAAKAIASLYEPAEKALVTLAAKKEASYERPRLLERVKEL